MKYLPPFDKWDKDKIIFMIKDSNFIFDDEYAGIFSFHAEGANRKDNFHLNFTLYLRKTMLYICNPNICISKSIKSHKQLNLFLKNSCVSESIKSNEQINLFLKNLEKEED